ncbi:rhomboid family intramembrane serine protease [Meridianimarinicoccus sp. RP-17]|uniref:rhomboid family intramembrane serine protease n=1 Tax=Meridianimarinicoccus zhengii TaxID=2056810 RepID=UPI001F45283F|nr:rhomboid family intramembrane serine protease [Phycocomes zhengii]
MVALTETERKGPASQRYMFHGLPLTVLVIAAVCILVELVLFAADTGMWADRSLRSKVYVLGAFWKPLLLDSQPLFAAQPVTMFGTYAFLHGGVIHMAVNMVALLSFGTAIVNRVGQKRFLVVYAVSALGGAVGFGLFSESGAPMVGASGALFGLLGVWICWDYLDRRYHGDPLWVTLRALVFLVAYNLVFWLLLQGQLAWETHFGGFVAGWLLAVFWGRSVLDQSRRRRGLARRTSSAQGT